MQKHHVVDGVAEDLGFVRRALARSEWNSGAPSAVFLVCSVIVLIGFPLNDFLPKYALTYWSIAAPLAFVVSAVIGRRHWRQKGQVDARSGVRHLAHWGVMLAVMGLCFQLPATGAISWRALGPLVLLLSAMGYLLAGVHLDRRFFLPGALMALGIGVMPICGGFEWTVTWVLVALALKVSARVGGKAGAVEKS